METRVRIPLGLLHIFLVRAFWPCRARFHSAHPSDHLVPVDVDGAGRAEESLMTVGRANSDVSVYKEWRQAGQLGTSTNYQPGQSYSCDPRGGMKTYIGAPLS